MSDVEAVGREAFIHWNGTPLNLMYIIAVKTLNRKYIFLIQYSSGFLIFIQLYLLRVYTSEIISKISGTPKPKWVQFPEQ